MDSCGDSLVDAKSMNGGSGSGDDNDNEIAADINNNISSSSSSAAAGLDFIDRHHHPSKRSQLLTVSFNQDGGCLAVGTANGFSVHNLYPQYSVSVERILRGGIGQIEMLFRCNLMAIVGGGTDPHSAPHRVLIWDDHIPKEIGELSFRQIVLKVKLRKDAIVVALRDRIYVYHLADLSLRDKIYTADNPFGLLSLSTNVQDMVLACPSVTMGHVRVELYGLRKTILIEAHESTLRALTLTSDGRLLATASHKGTIVRVWTVATSQNIYEFRRGVERAQITCLVFSCNNQWISCTSDKGTTHIFYLEDHSNNMETKTKKNGMKKKNNNGGSTNRSHGNSASISIASAGSSLFSSGSRLLAMSSLISSSGGKPQPKSVCQIRGVPHPLACSFIGDAPHLIAVTGWDSDGNGVLLISEFAAHQEARRVAYHVLVKNSVTADETEEERRRRRARGWIPNGASRGIPAVDNNDAMMYFGHLNISDEMAEETHMIQTQTTDDDFCEIIVEPRKEPIIDDKPISSSQEKQKLQQQPAHQSSPQQIQNNDIEEINFLPTDGNATSKSDSVTIKETFDSQDNIGSKGNNRIESNDQIRNAIKAKDEGIDISSDEKDSITTGDSVAIEPLEEDDEDDEDDANKQEADQI